MPLSPRANTRHLSQPATDAVPTTAARPPANHFPVINHGPLRASLFAMPEVRPTSTIGDTHTPGLPVLPTRTTVHGLFTITRLIQTTEETERPAEQPMDTVTSPSGADDDLAVSLEMIWPMSSVSPPPLRTRCAMPLIP